MGECGKYHPISDKVGSKMRREREEEDKERMKTTITMVYKMDVKNLEGKKRRVAALAVMRRRRA